MLLSPQIQHCMAYCGHSDVPVPLIVPACSVILKKTRTSPGKKKKETNWHRNKPGIKEGGAARNARCTPIFQRFSRCLKILKNWFNYFRSAVVIRKWITHCIRFFLRLLSSSIVIDMHAFCSIYFFSLHSLHPSCESFIIKNINDKS